MAFKIRMSGLAATGGVFSFGPHPKLLPWEGLRSESPNKSELRILGTSMYIIVKYKTLFLTGRAE